MTLFGDNRKFYSLPIALKGGETPHFNWFLDEGQLIDSSIIKWHLWEPYSTWAVEALVKPGMSTIDAGANMGYYTILLSHLVGPSGRVLSFEAMPDAAEMTRAHCKSNQTLNTEIRQQALGQGASRKERLFFNFSWPPNRCQQLPTEIEIVSLDSLHLQKLDFIKIDLDGSELDFLVGAMETLQRHHPILLLEVCDYTLRQTAGLAADPNYIYGSKVLEMLSILDAIGYQFFWEEDFSRATKEEAISKFDLSKRSINLVCRC